MKILKSTFSKETPRLESISTKLSLTKEPDWKMWLSGKALAM